MAKDDKGQVIQGRAELFQGDVNPEYAEAVAVKEALSWVKGGAWEKVVIETDCMAVVAVRSKTSMRSPFGQIIMECRLLLLELNIGLCVIRRSAKGAAHYITRDSCFFSGSSI